MAEPWGKGIWYLCLVYSWWLRKHLFSAFLPVVSFWIISVHCTKRLLWCGLRAVLIYTYENMCLEGSLICHSFSKVIVIGTCELLQPWVLCEPYSTRRIVTSCGAGFKSHQKAVGHPCNICDNTVPRDNPRVHSYMKLLTYFSPSSLILILWKVAIWGSSLGSTNLILPGLWTNYVVFTNSILSIKFLWWSRTVGIADIFRWPLE